MVNVDGGWQEMKTGSIMSEYGRSTIATMERAEGFGQLLFAEASRRGLEEADEVVFLADGSGRAKSWVRRNETRLMEDGVEASDRLDKAVAADGRRKPTHKAREPALLQYQLQAYALHNVQEPRLSHR